MEKSASPITVKLLLKPQPPNKLNTNVFELKSFIDFLPLYVWKKLLWLPTTPSIFWKSLLSDNYIAKTFPDKIRWQVFVEISSTLLVSELTFRNNRKVYCAKDFHCYLNGQGIKSWWLKRKSRFTIIDRCWLWSNIHTNKRSQSKNFVCTLTDCSSWQCSQKTVLSR